MYRILRISFEERQSELELTTIAIADVLFEGKDGLKFYEIRYAVVTNINGREYYLSIDEKRNIYTKDAELLRYLKPKRSISRVIKLLANMAESEHLKRIEELDFMKKITKARMSF